MSGLPVLELDPLPGPPSGGGLPVLELDPITPAAQQAQPSTLPVLELDPVVAAPAPVPGPPTPQAPLEPSIDPYGMGLGVDPYSAGGYSSGGTPMAAPAPAPSLAQTVVPMGDRDLEGQRAAAVAGPVSLGDRFALNASDAYYGGTLAGSGQLVELQRAAKMTPQEWAEYNTAVRYAGGALRPLPSPSEAQAEILRIAGARARYEAMPWSGGPLDFGAAVAGQLAGGVVTPESGISRVPGVAQAVGAVSRAAPVVGRTVERAVGETGQAVAGRMLESGLSQGVVNTAVDPLAQVGSIATGMQPGYDPVRTALAFPAGVAIGAGLHGATEAAGAGARALLPAPPVPATSPVDLAARQQLAPGATATPAPAPSLSRFPLPEAPRPVVAPEQFPATAAPPVSGAEPYAQTTTSTSAPRIEPATGAVAGTEPALVQTRPGRAAATPPDAGSVAPVEPAAARPAAALPEAQPLPSEPAPRPLEPSLPPAVGEPVDRPGAPAGRPDPAAPVGAENAASVEPAGVRAGPGARGDPGERPGDTQAVPTGEQPTERPAVPTEPQARPAEAPVDLARLTPEELHAEMLRRSQAAQDAEDAVAATTRGSPEERAASAAADAAEKAHAEARDAYAALPDRDFVVTRRQGGKETETTRAGKTQQDVLETEQRLTEDYNKKMGARQQLEIVGVRPADEAPVTRLTTEPDHTVPGQHVAKNEAGEVVGKGVTPEAAQVDAQARQNAPYAPEAPAARAEVPGTRPVSDYKAGDDVTVELDGRYQNAVVEKLGRSTIHVRIGSRVWRLPPSKVMFPAEAAAKRAEIHARNLGSIEPAEAPARLEDQAVVPGPREDTGTTGPGTEARVLSGSADEQTPAPTLTTLTTQTTRTPAQLQLEKLRATRDALTNKVRTPAEERKLGQINNQIARAERAERTVERRTQEQQDLQDRRGGRPFEGPPQVGRERDLLDYKFNDGTSVLRSVYEETGHDPDSAVSLPIHKQAEILTQHMVNKFGFSSVEVAGYRGRAASPVEQHQAVQAMLDTTRALQDGMASLGLPHDAVSLGGTLRLVIEPKGSTNYFGAYVFDGTIKVQAGANSYGHEWTHAIDHMLAERFTGNPTQMNKLLTQYARGSGLDTSDSVQGAFAKLINTMFYEDTALATRRLALETQAQKVDKTGKPTKGALDAQRQLKLMEGAGSKLRILSSEFRRESATFHPPKAGYYASVFEMLARSHEAYLANKMQMAGRDPRGFVMPDEAYLNMVDRQLRMAYPKGDERLEIFAAWDEVHHAMRRDQVLDAGKPPGDFPDYGISDNYRWRSTAPNARRTTLGQTISREINAIRNFPKTLAEHGGPFDKTRPKAPRSLGRRFVDHAQMAWSSNRGFLKILIAQMPDEAKPILQKLADSVATDPGSGRVTHENFHEATEKRRRTWNFQYGNIKENAGYGQYSRMPLEERLMLRHNLVTGETTYPVDPRLSSAGRVPIPAKVLKVAGPTRQLLNELWSVSEKAGLKIGFAKNGFFPRHYDRYKAAADPAGFKKAAIEMYDGMFDTELGAPGDKPQALFEKWADLPSESKERAAAKAGSNVDLPVQMRELQKKLLRQGAIEENPAPTPTERAELQTLKGEIQQLAADLHPLLRDFISETNADSWHANLTGGASHEFDTGMPTGKYLQTRVLPPEADIIMRDFMEQDPDVALPAYFSAVARRASYAEQFGPTGEGEAITRAKEQLKRIEGVDGLATEKFFDVIADMTGRAPRGGVRGFLQIPHNMAQAASAMVLMERAMWSSLHEGITASAVTGDHRAGFATIGRSIGQLVEAIGIGNQAARDRTTLAEFLGVITSPAYDNTMLSRMGAAYDDSPRMGWLLQEFYRTTGLTAITNGSRAASVGTTNWFLHKLSQHLLDTDAHARDNAKRWFNELGLPESTHKKFAQWMVDLEGKLPTPEMLSAEPGGNAAAMGLTGVHAELSGMGDAYSLATRRLVDRIIQDPKPADRAVYANVPIIGMAFQLMSFNYSFHENVLLPAAKRILYQFTRGRDEALAAGSGRRMANLKAAFGTTGTALNTLAIATSMVGAALMVWVVRQLLFAPDQLEEHAKKGDLVEYALRSAVSRSGLQGKWDPVIQMQNHAKYVSDVAGLTNGPGRNWAGKNISDALMLAGNSASTNTAEFNQARAMYNLIGTPVAAYGLSLLGSMGPISRIGAGIALQGGTSPGMSNWVATQWAGHKGATLPGAGGVGGTGLGRLPKLGGNMPKLGGGGRGAVPAVQHGSGFQGLIGDYTIPAIAYTAGAIPLLSVPAKVAAGVAAAGGAAYGLYEANKSVAPFRGLPKPPPKKRQ